MFKAFLFSLLFIGGSIQATDGLSKRLGGSRLSDMGRSQMSATGRSGMGSVLSRSSSSSLTGKEVSFLYKIGFLISDEVELVKVEEALDTAFLVVGKFKRQKGFKETLKVLLTEPISEFIEFERINSTEDLLAKARESLTRLLNSNTKAEEIEPNTDKLLDEIKQLIQTFFFCNPLNTSPIITMIFNELNAKAKAFFLSSPGPSEEYLKRYNTKKDKLSSDLDEIQEKVQLSLEFINENTGANGAELILREVEQAFYHIVSPKSDLSRISEKVYKRIAEAAYVADWAMVKLKADTTVERLFYLNELIYIACYEIKFEFIPSQPDQPNTNHMFDLINFIIDYFLQATSDDYNDDLKVIRETFLAFFVKFFISLGINSIPFSEEDPSYVSFVALLNEQKVLTQQVGPWSVEGWEPTRHNCTAFIELFHTGYLTFDNVSEDLAFLMFKNLKKIYDLTSKVTVRLGQTLFALNKFPYLFDPLVSIKDVDFTKEEKIAKLNKNVKADTDFANLMHKMIIDTVFDIEFSPEDVGIHIDATIDASDLTDDEKYFLKTLNGLTVFRHSEDDRYSVDYSKLKPSEAIKTRMATEWIFRESYNRLFEKNPTEMGLAEWKSELNGLTFQTDEVEAEQKKREKNDVKDLHLKIDIKGEADNLTLNYHELDQPNHLLKDDCEVETKIIKAMVAENIKILPEVFWNNKDKISEKEFKALEKDCLNAKRVEKNIINVIKGSLPEDLKEKLEESDEIVDYIQKHGVVRVPTPEGVHEYVFVKRTSNQNPCYDEEQ